MAATAAPASATRSSKAWISRVLALPCRAYLNELGKLHHGAPRAPFPHLTTVSKRDLGVNRVVFVCVCASMAVGTYSRSLSSKRLISRSSRPFASEVRLRSAFSSSLTLQHKARIENMMGNGQGWKMPGRQQEKAKSRQHHARASFFCCHLLLEAQLVGEAAVVGNELGRGLVAPLLQVPVEVVLYLLHRGGCQGIPARVHCGVSSPQLY